MFYISNLQVICFTRLPNKLFDVYSNILLVKVRHLHTVLLWRCNNISYDCNYTVFALNCNLQVKGVIYLISVRLRFPCDFTEKKGSSTNTFFFQFQVKVWGPNYMRDRKAMNIKTFLIWYNAIQVVASTYVFVQVRWIILLET